MKFRGNNVRQNVRQNRGVINKRLGATRQGIGKTFLRPQNGAVKKGDARLRIQQKKRNVVDARDVLAKMAQKQDARTKLMKIRATRSGADTNVRAIGTSIIRKTDRNGKITLVTKKTTTSPTTTTTIGVQVRKQLDYVPTAQRQLKPKKIVAKQQRLMTNVAKAQHGVHVGPLQRLQPNPTSIRRTILNDIMPEYPADDLYSWVRPTQRVPSLDSRRLQQSMRITARNDYATEMPVSMWRNFDMGPHRSIQMQTAYVDLDAVRDEEMPYINASVMVPSRPSTGVRARLDQASPHQTQSHGILSHTKTKVVVPVGHRIVISNLQQSVTQEDIRELFEDIGQLLVSRLVRPGTAEVIYKNLKDAQKAVDTYHNRQLDGQPMKCLLVNKRPINNPTGPAAKPAISSTETRRTLPAAKATTKLTPDISTIHKVLFHNKT